MKLVHLARAALIGLVWMVACSRPARVLSAPTVDKAPLHTVPATTGPTSETGLGGLTGPDPEPLLAEPDEPPLLIRPLPALGPFYEALDQLVRGERERSVRVMWLGDSHTAADFMTDEVRRALRRQAPMGGPGYVRLGLDGYRHSEVRLTSTGRFRHVPRLPAQRTRVLDGVFGYGGIRTVPQPGASVRAVLSSSYRGLVRWTLSYRLPENAALTLLLGTQKIELSAASADPSEAQAVLYREIEGDATQEFVLKHAAGQPEVFGVFVETLLPGVVLDTVGINGARAATVLAWDPAHFAEAVRLRGIDLLVLAFGTNEIFDNAKPERYEAHLRQIVENVRNVTPELPCWIVGPPDASTEDGRSRVRVGEVTAVQRGAAQDLGCAFSSGYELMGGERSFVRWMTHQPPWARGDRIHLTVAGYQELGRLLGDALLSSDVAPNQPGDL